MGVATLANPGQATEATGKLRGPARHVACPVRTFHQG